MSYRVVCDREFVSRLGRFSKMEGCAPIIDGGETVTVKFFRREDAEGSLGMIAERAASYDVARYEKYVAHPDLFDAIAQVNFRVIEA